MKTTFLFLFACLFATSCTSVNEKPAAKEEVPDALQDKKTKAFSYSRKSNDLVEDLYIELIEQHAELQALETDIDQLEKDKGKVSGEFYDYDNKNKSYYTSAGDRVNRIKDTLLKNSIELLIKKSQYGYNNKKAGLEKVLSSLNASSSNLQDHHEALKIILTMELMEKYQTQQLPEQSPYKAILDHYHRSIKTADSLLESH